MNILGIYGAFDWDANKSFNDQEQLTWVHDSGATLFVDGKHICSISEERLTKIKYEGNFPINSIEYCLTASNLEKKDIDIVCIPSMCIEIFYRQLHENIIENKLKTLFPNAKIQFVSHHLSHAAASVFSSNLNEGSFIVFDGAGSLLYDFNFKGFISAETNSIGYFSKNKNLFRFFPNITNINNFGGIYTKISHEIYCGKIKKDILDFDEKYRESFDGKIMGLSGYGSKSINFSDKFKFYQTSENLVYENYPYVIFNYEEYKNKAIFKTSEERAYILQKNFECALLDYVTALREKSYLDDDICFSGGSFLNVLGNSILRKSNLFKNIHIPPCISDTGLHFGAACFASFQNKEVINLPENIALLGKEYSEEEIELHLQDKKLEYKKYENFENLCKFVAEKINENKIIAWFQGRSEFGPRALGSRSLFMNPTPKENKDVMNERVKHREYWRPFAGIILEEYLTDYFEEDFNSPYMLYSLTVKENKRSKIAAITHVDNTCRIQTANKNLYPKVTTLIEKFKDISGVPVILNTSFNDNGEPIVESPKDAVKSFLNMNIDYLIIGNYVVTKKLVINKNNILYV